MIQIQLGQEPTEEEVETRFNQLDNDGSGHIDREEFCSWYMNDPLAMAARQVCVYDTHYIIIYYIYHVILHYIISHHITPHHSSYHTSHYITHHNTSHHITPHHTTTHHTTSYHIIHHIISHITSYHITSGPGCPSTGWGCTRAGVARQHTVCRVV